MSALVVGSDLGSSGCKTVVVNAEDGEVLAASRRDYPTISRGPGWAEQDPSSWHRALVQSIRDVLSHGDVDQARIVGLSIIGVTHTAVLLDGDGTPLAPSILMFDSRSQSQADDIAHRWGSVIEKRTLNSATPVWTWPQLEWVRDHRPDVWAKTERVVLQKDYVRELMGSAPGTDYIDAAGTLLYDPVFNCWVDDFLDDLGLSAETLPDLHTPWEQLGKVSDLAAKDSGLPTGTSLVTGTTDTVSEMLGSGAVRVGQGVVKLASVGRVAVVSEEPVPEGNVLNYRHLIDNAWYPGTASKYAASAYKWLRSSMWNDISGDDVYRAMDDSAATAPPGSAGLLFHPHLDGQWAPVWDEGLRSSFLGLSSRHDRSHMTRAVLEGVALSIRHALDELENRGVRAEEFKLIGQGSVSRLWAQIMADVLNRPLTVPAHVDAAYGAALVGAIGMGLLDNEAAAIETLVADGSVVYEPEAATASRYDELFGIYEESLTWQQQVSGRLTALERAEETH